MERSKLVDENKPMYVIYSLRLAGFLMYNGFPTVDSRYDYNNTGRKIYIFKNTENLHKYIELYKQNKGKELK